LVISTPDPAVQVQISAVSKKALWTGWIMTALPVLFLLMSGVMKLARPGFVVEGFKHLGLPEHLIIPIGILELTCTIIYLIPRTFVLGAILLTGYLGGARSAASCPDSAKQLACGVHPDDRLRTGSARPIPKLRT
jgi:DoxX-like family